MKKNNKGRRYQNRNRVKQKSKGSIRTVLLIVFGLAILGAYQLGRQNKILEYAESKIESGQKKEVVKPDLRQPETDETKNQPKEKDTTIIPPEQLKENIDTIQKHLPRKNESNASPVLKKEIENLCISITQNNNLLAVTNLYFTKKKQLHKKKAKEVKECTVNHILGLGKNFHKQSYLRYTPSELTNLVNSLLQIGSKKLTTVIQKIKIYQQYSEFYQNSMAEVKSKPCTNAKWNRLTQSLDKDMINKGVYHTNEQYNQLRELQSNLMLWSSDKIKYEKAIASPDLAQQYLNQIQISTYYKNKIKEL